MNALNDAFNEEFEFSEMKELETPLLGPNQTTLDDSPATSPKRKTFKLP